MTYWQALREVLLCAAAVTALMGWVALMLAPFLLFGPWGLIGTAPLFVLFIAFIHWRESNSPVSY